MKTPARMDDLRHIETGLSADEKRVARIEGLRQKARAALGDRWVLAREHAPVKGRYNELTGAKLA